MEMIPSRPACPAARIKNREEMERRQQLVIRDDQETMELRLQHQSESH